MSASNPTPESKIPSTEALADTSPASEAEDTVTPTAAATSNPGDDAIVDGRLSPIPPSQAAEEAENPSAAEAAQQASETSGNEQT